MKRLLLTVLTILVVLIAGFLIYLYSGTYNVAASEPHADLTRWTFSTLMVRSVESHAEDIEVPSLTDSSMIEAGFRAFDQMCVTCHGAPGVEASFIGKGLRPEAPELSEVAEHWSPAELYWILEHGIKMTGMPAFGVTHEDRQLWEIVAFVEHLPEITPEEYQALQARIEGTAGHGHDHQHGSSEHQQTDGHTHANGNAHEH